MIGRTLSKELNIVKLKIFSIIIFSFTISLLNYIIVHLFILSIFVIVAFTVLKLEGSMFIRYLRAISYFVMLYIITSVMSQYLMGNKTNFEYIILNTIKFVNVSMASLVILSTIKVKFFMLKDPLIKLVFLSLVMLHLVNEALNIYKEIKCIVKINYGINGFKGFMKDLLIRFKILTHNVLIEVIEYYEVSILRALEGFSERYYTSTSLDS